MNSIKKEEFYEDSRLKEIYDNLDNSKRSLDDTFQFQCDQCGKCCINREDILKNIQYFFESPNCGTTDVTHTVREWLEISGIPIEEVVIVKTDQCILFEKWKMSHVLISCL